jgi:hypothetical protein
MGSGAHVLFDPLTHVVDYPGANAFATYDDWQLWAGPRGDLSTVALRQGHVDRVVGAQQGLGLQLLAPTVRLEQPIGARANTALDLARRTLDHDPGAWLTIAGAPGLWSSGSSLDILAGQFSELRPAGFIIVVARPTLGYPAPGITPDEVEGMCRTVHSLSIRVPVVVSHGDLAALPAVAAGATGVGSGWDLRQRVLGGDAFQVSSTFRRRGSRVTHIGLLSSLKRAEAERLRVRDAALSARLVPGPLPVGQVAEYQDHLRALADLGAQLGAQPSGRARVDELQRLYAAADADFQVVEGLARPIEFGRWAWLDPVTDGLAAYRAGEGW